MIDQILRDFHFLRPEWFFAIIPMTFVYLLLKYAVGKNSNWLKTIDPLLLPYLMDERKREISRSPLSLIIVCWCLAIIAIAGPAWQKTERPLHERKDALVILFDLTKSMYAVDVSPNRLTRAHRKLQDLLIARTEGVTGLIVFAGDAHVVSPLTNDTDTIISMIPALTPSIMPGQGSQLTRALVRAIALFKDADVNSGRILIITDEIRDIANAQTIANTNRFSFPISLMSVGTETGAAISLNPDRPDAGFLKDLDGNLVIAKVDLKKLQKFADAVGGRFARMTLMDEDIEYLLSPNGQISQTELRKTDRNFDSWEEEGPWILLLLLPLASLAFRQNWLWTILVLFLIPSSKTYAIEWIDLWQTKDQQGFEALQQGDSEKALSLFKNPNWKASAFYRSGQYDNAEVEFSNIATTDGKYNLGNTLAKQGRLQEALDAYTEALLLDRNNEDAAFNKNLIENELNKRQQNQEQQSQEQKNQGQENQEQGNEEQQSQEQQNQEQENQEQGNEEQQSQEQENQEQENQEQQNQEQQNQEIVQRNDSLGSEEERALEQWLRRIPDNPGGLLRRKFQRQYEDRVNQGQLSQSQRSDW
ncbi:MAG: VWA domain-containing protein [OM182 bacterium]|uniref:VWA domain-containing protein n=1 Tax=OM182 bacterium TaxID=2510334 RepID=A0A520RZ81_9GAMM|nr:MAG: VWA domain-containing protein [OM182 bacterium]